MNTTGPGDYEAEQLIGKKNMIAHRKNVPSFSIGKQDKHKMLVFDRA